MTTGKTGDSRSFEINESDVKTSIVSFTQQTAYVEIVFALQSYLIGSVDLVKYQYSIDGGANWVDMSEYSGSSGTTGLTCNRAGKQHSFYWDAVKDIGVEAEFTNVKVRFSATDGSQECDAAVSDTQTVDFRPAAPSAMNPAGGLFLKDTTPDIIFKTPELRRECYLHFKIEIDDDPEFGSATEIDSSASQTGWYYWEPDAAPFYWENYPAAGLNSADYPENRVKHTLQAALSLDNYYVRITNIIQHVNRMCGETGAYCGDGTLCGTPLST